MIKLKHKEAIEAYKEFVHLYFDSLETEDQATVLKELNEKVKNDGNKRIVKFRKIV